MIHTHRGISYDTEARTVTEGGVTRPFTDEEESAIPYDIEANLALIAEEQDALRTSESAAWNTLLSNNPLTYGA